MGMVALLSAAVAFAPASPSMATPLSYDCRGFSGESLFCAGVFISRLTEFSDKPVPLRLCCWVAVYGKYNPVWEPHRQEGLRYGIVTFPPFDGLDFCVCGEGGIVRNGTHGHSIGVPPVCGLHGLSETRGKSGPVTPIFFKIGDSVKEGEGVVGHGDVLGHVAAMTVDFIGLGQGP